MEKLTLNDFQKKSLITKYKDKALLKIEDKESEYGLVSFININIQDHRAVVGSDTWDLKNALPIVKTIEKIEADLNYTIKCLEEEIQRESQLKKITDKISYH